MKNKKNRNLGRGSKVDRDERIIVEGVVEEALPNTMFRVLSGKEHAILATLSGKLRQNHIRILPGDKVRVEVSQYDTSRGRIVWRS